MFFLPGYYVSEFVLYWSYVLNKYLYSSTHKYTSKTHQSNLASNPFYLIVFELLSNRFCNFFKLEHYCLYRQLVSVSIRVKAHDWYRVSCNINWQSLWHVTLFKIGEETAIGCSIWLLKGFKIFVCLINF